MVHSTHHFFVKPLITSRNDLVPYFIFGSLQQPQKLLKRDIFIIVIKFISKCRSSASRSKRSCGQQRTAKKQRFFFRKKIRTNICLSGADVLKRVLVSIEDDNRFYEKSGAIIHPYGLEKSIDCQPYPYPSYIEELVKSLKTLWFRLIMRFFKRLIRLLRPKTLSMSNLSNMH